MLTCTGLCIPAIIYRHVVEQIEATSLPPQMKLHETLGLISFLLPRRVLRNSNGNVWPTGRQNVLLKTSVISSLNWASDHSDVKEIFPMRPFSANFALESPLGMQIMDAEDKGKHTTSLV